MRPLATFQAVLVLAFALNGCGLFSKSSRDQSAYAKYVRKSSMGRVKQQSRFRSNKPAMPPAQKPGEPVESTLSGPQAVPTEN